MNYSYLHPPVPTLARWRKMTRLHRGQSVLRMMEYERLSTLKISGRVLDMGGGRMANYRHLLPTDLILESVNIDPSIEPTHLVQPGQPLPFADNSYDAVICFNTLEHIYDATNTLSEIFRVVRPGGQVHVIVPFMFRIHGHPDDYFRATPSWWRETFRRAGFSAMELLPLVWGRGATRALVPGYHGPFPRLRAHIGMLQDILLARLLLRGNTISGPRGDRICGTAPGWFMTGTK